MASRGKEQLKKALQKRLGSKQDKTPAIPALLGAYVNGRWQIQVQGRSGFVYARVHGNESDVVEAYNDVVGLIPGVSILLTRDEITPSYYRVKGKDVTKYQQSSAFTQLGWHADQHTFNTSGTSGKDILWLQKRQFTPFLLYPASSTGSMMCRVDPEFYIWNGCTAYFSGGYTPDLSPIRPSASLQGAFATIYVNGSNGTIGVMTGTSFNYSPWPSDYLKYVPFVSGTTGIPLASVFVQHETAKIDWPQIFDLRPFMSMGGSGGGTIGPGVANQLALWNSTSTITNLGSLGTTGTALHGNAGGLPSFGPVTEIDLSLSNNTIGNVTTGSHGWAPKGVTGTTQFWRQDWTLATPAGGGLSSGIAFPGSPSNGDIYFRTDLGLLCYYSATASHWLTVNEFCYPLPYVNCAYTSSPWTSAVMRTRYDYAPYFTRICCGDLVQTPNSGTKYWTILVRGWSADQINGTTIFSFATNADTEYVWTAHDGAASTPNPTNYAFLGYTLTATSTAGWLNLYVNLYARLIIT